MDTLRDDDLLMKAFSPTDFRGHPLDNMTISTDELAADLPTSAIPRLFPIRNHSPAIPLTTESMTTHAFFSKGETRYMDDSRSSSNETVEIHLPRTPDYPLSETSSDSGGSDCETPSYPRVLAQIQNSNKSASLSKETYEGEATVRGRDHMKENRAKVPWQSPSQEDFTSRTKSQNVTCRPSQPPSQGIPSYNGHTIGRVEGRRLVEERDDAQSDTTIRNDSPALTLSEFAQDRQSTPEADCEREGSGSCTDADTGTPSLTVSRIGKQASNITTQGLKSPNISPRIWLRRDISSGKYFTFPAAAPTHDTTSRMSAFDLTVELYTSAAYVATRGIQVLYHARLTVVNYEKDTIQGIITLPIIVKNALDSDRICKLDPGKTAVLFKEDVGGPLLTNEGWCTITVVREFEDLDLPLDLYFTFDYPPEQRDLRVMIPSFRPRLGNAVSERVFVMNPSLPLVLKALGRSQLSTWIPTDHPGYGTYFERTPIPRLYPEEFLDDICVKFTELKPVQFKESPLSDYISNFVWDFDVTLSRICDARLQCQMRMRLAIGEGSRLLSINPCGWIPQIFVIDGHPATEGEGEWRKDDDGYILIKQPKMVSGQIVQIDMYWQEAPAPEPPNDNVPYDFILPRVTDHKIRSGKLSSDLAMASFTLINPMAVPISFTLKAAQSTALTALQQGHSISLRIQNSTKPCSKSKLLRLPKSATGYLKSHVKKGPRPKQKNGVHFADQGEARSRQSAIRRNTSGCNKPVNEIGGGGDVGVCGDSGDDGCAPGNTATRQRRGRELREWQTWRSINGKIALLVLLATIWTLLWLVEYLDAGPATPVKSATTLGPVTNVSRTTIEWLNPSNAPWLVRKWETPQKEAQGTWSSPQWESPQRGEQVVPWTDEKSFEASQGVSVKEARAIANRIPYMLRGGRRDWIDRVESGRGGSGDGGEEEKKEKGRQQEGVRDRIDRFLGWRG